MNESGQSTAASVSSGRWGQVGLVVTGLIPLLGLAQSPPDTMLVLYSIFVLACLARRHLRTWVDRIELPMACVTIGMFVISGTLTEALAWLNNYLKAAPEPALFHPQLLADILIGFGFYGGWACAWLIALRWFQFTLAEVFIVTGLQGIFFEQLGAIFIAMVRMSTTQPLLSVIFGLYVFAVHGSAAALALCPVLHRFDSPDRSRHAIRFLVVAGLMVGLAFLGCWLVSIVSAPFGGLPPKRSITEHPFW